MILLTHLLDPIQFILYWIALFFNQIWIEYIKFQEKNLDIEKFSNWNGKEFRSHEDLKNI